MPSRHDRFVHLENIRNFEKQIEAETDPVKRAMLVQLLAEEWARKLTPPYTEPEP